MKFRVGNGFDVHQFIEDKARPLMLGGVAIPSNLSLLGHSDADVLLHALTDALLGALGKGDIGEYFPPSDEKWAGVQSSLFLRHAVHLMQELGGKISNIDASLICEVPKISPHKQAISKKIAEICGIDECQVNIKATTTEGLGFTGRKEGIACLASVLIFFD